MTDLEVVVEGLVDLGHHVGPVGQRGLDLLETLRQQRQLLPVVREKRRRKEVEKDVSVSIDRNNLFWLSCV